MNEHVGASFTLSVAIVAFFAVALYQRPAPSSPVPASAVSATEARPPDRSDVQEAPPISEKRHSASAPIAARQTSPPRSNSQRQVAAAGPPARVVPRQTASESKRAALRGLTRRTDAPAPPSEPRGAFTKVRDGETLADVAMRVYGADGEVAALWRANRDLIDRDDSRLAAGMMLRTP
jgi:hypothetical protein